MIHYVELTRLAGELLPRVSTASAHIAFNYHKRRRKINDADICFFLQLLNDLESIFSG